MLSRPRPPRPARVTSHRHVLGVVRRDRESNKYSGGFYMDHVSASVYPSYHCGITLVAKVLDGNNYGTWSRFSWASTHS